MMDVRTVNMSSNSSDLVVTAAICLSQAAAFNQLIVMPQPAPVTHSDSRETTA